MVGLRVDLAAVLQAVERPAVTVVRAGGLGDTVLVLPVLELLRRAAPGAELTLVGSAWAEELSPLLTMPVHVVRFDGAAMTPLFAPGAKGDPTGSFAQADLTVIYAADAADPLVQNVRRLCRGVTIRWPVHPDGECHAAAHFAAAVAGRPPDVSELPGPPLSVPSDASEKARAWLEDRLGTSDGVLAIHPGSGGRRKCWVPSNFAQVARALGRPVLLLEGPADAEPCRRVEDRLSADVRRARAAGLPMVDAASLLGRCRLYVGNDSGISHVAAALGVPTVAVFGPTDPQIWRPLGRCVAACSDRAGWPAPEKVVEACREALRLDFTAGAE